MRNFVLTAVLGGLSTSFASTLEVAQALLDKGDVPGALGIALALNTADGFTLAAKATVLSASLAPEGQQEAIFEKAVNYAKKAIELNPNNANAHFELARAEVRLSQFKGTLQSLGMAGDVKSSLNRVLDLNPRHAGAYVALGLWNAEMPIFAGGNRAQVQPNFEKAIQLEPQVVTHRLEYANALMKVNRRNKQSAINVLERAVLLTPRNFWEQRDLEAAKRYLSELKR